MSKEPSNQKLAQKLGMLRYRAQLTQREIAELGHFSAMSVKNWESGRIKPSSPHLKQLIEIYMELAVFSVDSEEMDARELWEMAERNVAFDEDWFNALRSKRTSNQSQPAAPTTASIAAEAEQGQHEPAQADQHDSETAAALGEVGADEHVTTHKAEEMWQALANFYTSNTTPGLQERLRMLEYLQSVWIKGVLEKSVQSAISITLELHEQPEAVTNPLSSPLWGIYRSTAQLFKTTSIVEMYEIAHRKLLILGEPGSGKTTLLLELMRTLLESARVQHDQPIPVMFNLISWAKKRQPLTKWLIEELYTKYQLPRKLGQLWINSGQLLPLLDGLDEVPSGWRAACVDAINAYLHEHGPQPIVVCSRKADYQTLARRLQLHNAAVIQPVTEQQIDIYLQKAGIPTEALLKALRTDATLRALATTPLMLLILVTTYESQSAEDTLTEDTLDPRRQALATYVNRMLDRHSPHSPYEREQTLYWLKWLAQHLDWQSQNDFYIELMQFSWLPEYPLRRLYPGFAVGLVYGILSAIGFGISYLPYFPLYRVLLFILLIALFNMLVYGFFNGILFGLLDDARTKAEPASAQQTWGENIKRRALKLVGNRVVYGILNGLLDGIFVGLLVNPVSGWICAIFTAAFCAVLGRLDGEIQCAAYLSWSWSSIVRNVHKFLIGGLSVGLLYGLVTGRDYLFMPAKLLSSLFLGLGIGLLVGLIMSIRGGFTSGVPDTEKMLQPNQGIRNSIKYSLGFGIFFGLAFGLLFGFIYGPALFIILGSEYRSSFPAHSGLIYGASDGFIVAAFFWLLSGGIAYVQHIVLRFILVCTGSAPWNYQRFLDYATDCKLLRRVGGGYIFVHSLLRDYIAAVEVDTRASQRGPHIET